MLEERGLKWQGPTLFHIFRAHIHSPTVCCPWERCSEGPRALVSEDHAVDVEGYRSHRELCVEAPRGCFSWRIDF